MKSIRVSLILYFLLLLAAGLGAASFFAYRAVAASLVAKQEQTSRLLRAQFDSDSARVSKQFDDELRAQAFDIARVMAVQNQWRRPRFLRITPIALIGQVQAHLAAPLWVAEATSGPNSPLNGLMTLRLLGEVTLSEVDLPHTADTADHEYFQINANWSPTWRSKSLGDQELPYDATQFANKDIYAPEFDDVTLATNLRVRRTQLKVPTTRFTRPGRTGGGGPGLRQSSPPTPPPENPVPRERPDPPVFWIVIHCASDTIRRDAALTALKTDIALKLDEQASAAAEELGGLRRRLLLIGVGAFLATTVGGFLLVGMGLAPLRRLSDAVSRVSPRDFRLPLEDDASLGAELAPIAGHLRATLEQLRRAFEREKQAAADISHELRTPVASLLTTLEVALRKPRSAEEYRQTLIDCRSVGRQMRQLVERLMALARLDAGSDHVRPSEVDVGGLVEEVTTLVKPLAGERGLELQVHCPDDVTCTTDPDKLREILVNLLHNAIQYNRPHGKIDVSASRVNGWLDLRVHDTGIGIAPEASERIFERFYRADPSRNDSGLHAGLGLSIVKGYVGLLGGTISVESQAGQGSTFHVRLPASLAA